jgi:hypothetical protein
MVVTELTDETGKEIKTQFFVEIVHSTEAKRMLGGFYDMRNNKTYHHAATSPPDFDERASPEKPACECISFMSILAQSHKDSQSEEFVYLFCIFGRSSEYCY